MNIVLRVADRAGETFYLFLRHVDDMECQTLGCLVSDPGSFDSSSINFDI